MNIICLSSLDGMMQQHVTPSGEALAAMGIEEIAEKLTQDGWIYEIKDSSEVVFQPSPKELSAAANAAKEQALANLTVTVDGMTLKADYEARQNLADAIRAAETLRALPVEQAAAALGLSVEQVEQYGGIETLTATKPWKLADKTVAVVTLEQLKLASALAIVAVGNLVVP